MSPIQEIKEIAAELQLRRDEKKRREREAKLQAEERLKTEEMRTQIYRVDKDTSTGKSAK